MKKFGFTLVELMAALIIVGVIAAIVIPTFTKNANYQTMATKLSKTVSELENLFTTMIAEEGVNNLAETEFVTKIGQKIFDSYFFKEQSTILSKYIKTTPTDRGILLSSGAEIRTWINNNYTYTIPEATAKNYGIPKITILEDRIRIDVNGFNNKPNKYGRDQFDYFVDTNGKLYPLGSLEVSLYWNGSDDHYWKKSITWEEDSEDGLTRSFGCTTANGKEYGCGARLMENNYKVDY